MMQKIPAGWIENLRAECNRYRKALEEIRQRSGSRISVSILRKELPGGLVEMLEISSKALEGDDGS